MVSVRRVAPVLLVVMATASVALTASAQRQSSQPPRDLHRVGDHWTAYNPPDPSTYPAGARTHEIKSGDTLWQLAQQYYSNAYLWPQLWESNTWITDAHWIYPGDVLLVGGEGTASAEGTTSTTGGEGALTTVTPRTGTMAEGENAFNATQTDDGFAVARMAVPNNPVALGTEADIFCYGYIGDPNEPMPNYVQSHEDVEVKYLLRAVPEMSAAAAPGDLVYISGGAATGLAARSPSARVSSRCRSCRSRSRASPSCRRGAILRPAAALATSSTRASGTSASSKACSCRSILAPTIRSSRATS
jgi:LysM repeat protein